MKTLCSRCIRVVTIFLHPYNIYTGSAITASSVYTFLRGWYYSLRVRCTASHGTSPCRLLTGYQPQLQALHWTGRQLVYCGYRDNRGTVTYTVQWRLRRAQVLQLFRIDGSSCGDGYDCRFTGRTWERRFRAIQRHIYSHEIISRSMFIRSRRKENPHREDHHLRLRHHGRRRRA